MKIGQFEFELKELSVVDALPFVPFFQRYLTVMSDEREDLRKEYDKLSEQYKKEPENEDLLEQMAQIAEVMHSEANNRHMSFFSKMNEFEWKELKKFLAKTITKWNLRNKDGELPITLENIDKIPVYMVSPLLEHVAVKLLLGNTGEINFSTEASVDSAKQQKKTKG